MKPAVALVTGVLFAANAAADPCGMVPPVWEGQGSPIQRVGPQKTYVFYKDGVETFVIRPGFSGNVDNFGMLIPFPSVPSIRKVPDQTFAHIAAAVDPPEVVIDLRPREFEERMMMADKSAEDEGGAERSLGYEEVRVLKKEAVGMYEIAVLEAGSPKALNRWMDEHGYQYPKGMDRPVADYVKDKWCFVAVKTRVGAKGQVDPKPGMREANPQLPKGSTFDGHVQAMGFRFRVKSPIVPMRLSTFNEGELRNIVYVLHEDPVQLDGISKNLIKRQVKGQKTLENLTELLPLRIYGGALKDVKDQLEGYKHQRSPVPHNGAARDLFASDLLAANTRKLSHDHEEREKQLLNINERLNLRGPEIDRVLGEELKKDREETVLGALPDLKSMTLTVVDGDFPREFLAENNIKFTRWKMPAHLNLRAAYQARSMSSEGRLGGVRVEWNGDQTDQRENPVLRFWKDLWD